MDYDFRRPHRRSSVARPLAPSFATAQPHSAPVSSMSVVQSTATVPAIAQSVAQPEVKKLDFTSGAKTYRRKVTQQSILHGLAISVYVLFGFACLLAAGGIYVNHKYSGRAIPFTYVGDISIGGLTEPQIKEALDTRAKEITISFVDGGLVRTVPASQFDASFDTATVAYQATHGKFNPFAYLNKRRFEIAATINERQINGYITTVVNPTKTASTNAQLVVEKKKLKIIPETQGFRANPQFINDRIKLALTTMTNPVVKVNLVSVKPDTYATDLEDDLARANTLVNSAVALQYGKTTIKPSVDDKISWLQITEVPGTNNVSLTFSKSLIRQYVITQANKFQASGGTKSDDATLTTQKGTVIDNIDEATDALTVALNNGTSLTQKLTSKQGTYNKLVSAN